MQHAPPPSSSSSSIRFLFFPHDLKQQLRFSVQDAAGIACRQHRLRSCRPSRSQCSYGFLQRPSCFRRLLAGEPLSEMEAAWGISFDISLLRLLLDVRGIRPPLFVAFFLDHFV